MLREVLSTELYTISLIICLVLVAIAKLLFPKRFQDFLMLLINFRYLKVYSREQKFIDVFEGLLFTNLIIGLSVFILLCFNLSISIPEAEYLTPPKLAFGIGMLILIKILLERLVSSILNMDSIIDNYIFQKVSYKNFLGLLLIPINAILIYSWYPTRISTSVFIILLILINVYGILIFIKDNLKTIKKNWLYFILYLCALEISPYLVLYKIYTL
ncbi:DUF4271 domain-containing protein [Lacinutrix sp. Bg11-31]|uniref:DUF4271 domain-containing protein n=1 Tax=Lacinutrix sp. Bg11-31 TaxID=2057808 RepID=UPI000C2FF7D9|nr:DUF4271 domain-containing protein [Lacinutrix sp. Bg11-31]AUC82618.1 DUF4271 domain-containing protein [Lacinutrix sp. Bg11-31]